MALAHVEGGRADADAAVTLRPAVIALLEAQPLPAFLIAPSGPPFANDAARRFLTSTDAGPRVLAHDGTDLWTIISGRIDEADPFLDVHIRLRDVDGLAVETVTSVVPIGGPSGALSAAVAFVFAMPGERLGQPHAGAPDEMKAIVERVGVLLDAGRVCITEFDTDVAPEAKMRCYWSPDDTPAPPCSFALAGTPAGSFGGKRVLVVPSGVTRRFPDAPRIEGFESYAGVTLVNARGEAIGVLGATWRTPITDVAGVTAVLCIAGAQASRALSDAIARRELKESEQRYGAVFEGSGMPMLLIEPTTTQVVDVNPSACSFYGFSHDEFTSMSILQLDTMGAETLQTELERAMQGARDRFAAQHILSGGWVRDVEVSISPVRVAGRRLLCCMVNDITERKRMEAALERSKRSLEQVVGQRTEDLLRANAELQQASMSRDAVLGDLAQELRTSVQTITGFSQLLLEGIAGELTGEQRRQVEMVQQAGTRLSSFASALVESHSAQADPAQAGEFDLVSLVESVTLGLASFAEDKGLSLCFETAERPVVVRSDRYKVQQILLNLLSNGIRYTETGFVTVSVTGCRDGQTSVAVSDTGVGIAPDVLATLFSGGAEVTGKAGIGLPASKRIATAVGGTIDAESTPGRGSVFTLRLPCPENGDQDKDANDE